jgi:hypothetical protein
MVPTLAPESRTGVREITERLRDVCRNGWVAASSQPFSEAPDSTSLSRGQAGGVSRFGPNGNGHRPIRSATERNFLFVFAAEPLVAAEAVWSTPTPIDLCVSDASTEAQDTGAFACAGHPVRVVEEPLLAPRPGEGTFDSAVRWADALRALYALDTRSALVVCHRLLDGQPLPALLDESWLLQTAEQIEQHLPLP